MAASVLAQFHNSPHNDNMPMIQNPRIHLGCSMLDCSAGAEFGWRRSSRCLGQRRDQVNLNSRPALMILCCWWWGRQVHRGKSTPSSQETNSCNCGNDIMTTGWMVWILPLSHAVSHTIRLMWENFIEKCMANYSITLMPLNTNTKL